jgi:hypothetical protein
MASRRVKRIHFLIDTQLFRLPSPDYVDSDSNCATARNFFDYLYCTAFYIRSYRPQNSPRNNKERHRDAALLYCLATPISPLDIFGTQFA